MIRFSTAVCTLLLLLVFPVLALSGQPSSKKKDDKPVVERSSRYSVVGASGTAVVEFYKRGDQRWVQLYLADAERGVYSVSLTRGSERLILGAIDHPTQGPRTLGPEHPEFSRLYSGYWDGFEVVKKGQEKLPAASPTPAPPTPSATPSPELDF